ncbi:MAG: hypothetical protein HQL46_01920, partial [Gammaproteobacteria bacterium]|nr:hypothetical protein [Gammaproteobacteria bacterium]
MFKNIRLIWQSFILIIFISLVLLSIALFLWFSDLFIGVWDKLVAQSSLFIFVYTLSFILFLTISIGLFYRFIRRFPFSQNWLTLKSSKEKPQQQEETIKPEISIEDVSEKVQTLKENQINIDNIEVELEKLKNINVQKDIIIVIF